MKTHSGSKKRFRVTASGKIKCKRAGLRHILTKMNTKRKRTLRAAGTLAECDTFRVKRLLCLK
jgi:large subunit ribosomal protein L35